MLELCKILTFLIPVVSWMKLCPYTALYSSIPIQLLFRLYPINPSFCPYSKPDMPLLKRPKTARFSFISVSVKTYPSALKKGWKLYAISSFYEEKPLRCFLFFPAFLSAAKNSDIFHFSKKILTKSFISPYNGNEESKGADQMYQCLFCVRIERKLNYENNLWILWQQCF